MTFIHLELLYTWVAFIHLDLFTFLAFIHFVLFGNWVAFIHFDLLYMDGIYSF